MRHLTAFLCHERVDLRYARCDIVALVSLGGRPRDQSSRANAKENSARPTSSNDELKWTAACVLPGSS